MAVAGSRVTVTTTATALSGADSDGVYGHSVLVKNTDAAVSVHLGGSDVTASTGFTLGPGEAVSLEITDRETVYGRTSSGSAVCHVLSAGG